MAEHDGLEHGLFRQTVGFGLDHQHGAFGAGDDEVEAARLELRDGGVHDELVVDVAHAAGADRTLEGDAGNREGGRGADHRGDVGIDFGINGEHVNDDLHFVEESIREKRTDRAVNETAREGFLLGRTAFALEEAAGELARGIGLLDVVDGEREEVLAGLGFLLGDDGRENHGVVHLADDGAGSLAGDFAGGERYVVITKAKALGDFVEHGHG